MNKKNNFIKVLCNKIFICIKLFFNSLLNLFTSKFLLFSLIVCLFVCLLQVSTGFEEILIKKEQEMMNIDEINLNVSYYYDDKIENYNDDIAIDELINCYQKPLDKLNNSINDNINKLNNLYKSSGYYFSFLYYDLYSGFTVEYNSDAPIFTASTIKAPAMIYIYEMASKGKIDLNEKLVYTSNFYSGGTGVLKNKKVNTSYTIEELIQYTIYDSDNIAYSMLVNRYGRENILKFWKEFNTKYIFEDNTIWGFLNAKDASIYMKELYSFYKENNEYGEKLLNHFKKAKFKLISGKNINYNTANKTGWSGTAIHDAAIVFDKNPYILVILSNLGESSYEYLFNTTSNIIGNMHEEYWKYKVEICSNIKLY